MCKLLNPTLESVYLRRCAKIGTIEPIDLNVGKTAVCSLESKTDHDKRDVKTERPPLQSSEEVINELGIKIDKSSLSEGDYFKLVNFLAKNQDIFARSLADLPGTDLMLHRIDTGDAPPFRQRIYRTSPEAKREISRQTAEMLKMGIIRESNSEYQSNVVLVSKKNGEKRFCVDFRKLNSQTKSLNYPIMNMEDVLDTLSDKKVGIFSTLDLKSGYWQVRLDPETAHKTAFITHQGIFEFTRLAVWITQLVVSFSHS